MQTRAEHANSTQKGPIPARYRAQDPLDIRQKEIDSDPGPVAMRRQYKPLSNPAALDKWLSLFFCNDLSSSSVGFQDLLNIWLESHSKMSV